MPERIVIDPNICNGRLAVRGTRIAAQTVLEFLAAGDGIEDMLACLEYGARVLSHRFTLERIA
ncbi:DUF433 domain-containing protein [Deinococcus planocerae]|uniref:DUF433 domain-containing protein n=1 Tax=Deinococcus planocerae TaxID=1737569 RepID=UPI000C7F154F|nr:DUF433 domain-containing protein [Deinococcus planocerae]